MEYERDARAFGEPKYTIASLLKLAFDGIFNFSYKPLQLVMLSGGIIAAVTLIIAALVLSQYVSNVSIFGYNPHQARGWTSLILAVLFLAGVELVAIGVLGEYVGRLFEEVKARPIFLVKEAVNFDTVVQETEVVREQDMNTRAVLDKVMQCMEATARRIVDEAIREIERSR